jgi:hypothetical protein
MVEAFRPEEDPYKLMAARIYNKPIEQVNKDERFMGKQGVLGAGYGVGKHGFMNMLWTIYDIIIPEEEAERIVHAYRTSNQKVVNLWYAMDRLAKQTILEQPQKAHLLRRRAPHRHADGEEVVGHPPALGALPLVLRARADTGRPRHAHRLLGPRHQTRRALGASGDLRREAGRERHPSHRPGL